MEQGLIVVMDYGMGNLGSITKALEYVGGTVLLSANPEDVQKAERIVLPGVGAFGDGMKNLRERGLVDALHEEVMEKKKPFLGICLGMQLLAKKSYEFGGHDGLGFIDAEVKRLEPAGGLKVPHVGWNNVVFQKDHPLLSGIASGADFYFVHSYHMKCTDGSVVIGETDYGRPMTAIIAKDNIFATQFHPEKSQKDGLKILENFIRLPAQAGWDGVYA